LKKLLQKLKAFTLVEILVVVAIISIFSVSAVVGFGYLGDILRAREITGYIADVIKQEELKVLRGDFVESNVHFYPHFLIVTEKPEDAQLALALVYDGDCASEEGKISFGSDANLIKKNGDGEVLDIISVSNGDYQCVEFVPSDETEWSFQLSDAGKVSNIIRFIHFNLDRENWSANPLSLFEDSNKYPNSLDSLRSRVEIKAPYSQKKTYNSLNVPLNGSNTLSIMVHDQQENSVDELILR
jgi:prepilin-type N-terminal cleavage/methylation domain-containing protein